jgi:mannose-1-phosphate guanylyltransferase
MVFPSDHYVDDGSAFREHVERAILLVDRFPTKIALLGVRPTHQSPHSATSSRVRRSSQIAATNAFFRQG